MMVANEENLFETDRETCIDCKKEAPQTDTNYTLISQQHAWRLTRSKTSTGRTIHEWRCPECYEKFRPRRKP
jgi:hypothetical protein